MRFAFVICISLLLVGATGWMNWTLWRERESNRVVLRDLVLKQVTVERIVTKVKPRVAIRISEVARPPWALLESEDYFQYAANLRAIGCPEKTLRDILVADVERNFEEQRKAIENDPDVPFWLNADQREAMEHERLLKGLEIEQQQWELLRKLFGYDINQEALDSFRKSGLGEAIGRVLLGFLPQETVLRLAAVVERRQWMVKAIDLVTYGILLPEDFEKRRQIRDQLERELGVLIGPAAVEELQLRLLVASSESKLPHRGRGVQVSGPEMRALCKVLVAGGDFYSTILNLDEGPSLGDWDERLSRDVEIRIAQLLGKDRFADFTRARDERFRQIYSFTSDNNLPKEAAIRAFEERLNAEDDFAKIRNDSTLTEEQRVTLLVAVRARAQAVINRNFGDELSATFAKSLGQWFPNTASVPVETEGKP